MTPARFGAVLRRPGRALAFVALVVFGPNLLALVDISLALLAAALLLALWFGRDALLRARLAATPAPGLVKVREGRVGYLGPEDGGVVDLDALISIEMIRRPEGPMWVLRPAGPPPVMIPAAAEGADALIDTLCALPGFDTAAVAAALDAPLGAHAILWRRKGPLPVAS